MISDTIVYTLDNCPNCIQSKNILQSHNINFIEKDLSNPDVITELNVQDIIPLTAPIIYFNGEHHFTLKSLQEAIHDTTNC